MSVDKSRTLFHDMQDQIPEQFEFSEEKNKLLIMERGVSFEDVIEAIRAGRVLKLIDHHNQSSYSHQRIYVVKINDYAYMAPFVRKDNSTVFLKTIIPSRKLTKKYLTGKGGEE